MEANGKTYDGIWVGRCDTWKRPELFLKLAENNPDKKFIIICPPATKKDEYFTLIKNQAQTLKSLEFVDFSTQKDVYFYLAKSKVFCFTSEKEGDWPMVVLEAAATGLPILSYNLSYGDLVEKYHGGFNCQGDFSLLNDRFSTIVENPEMCKTMGNNAYKYIFEHHNIKINANEFLRIIANEKM
jgi:glycosyltransferase involved in cell wall biosynthesis